MNEVIKPFTIKKLYVMEKHKQLKEMLASLNEGSTASDFFNAIRGIKGHNTQDIVNCLLANSSFYEKDINKGEYEESERIKKIRAEILDVIHTSEAIQTGFCYDEKKEKFYFNANLFADYFLQRVITCCDQHGILYVYNHKGYYQECNSVQLGKIIRTLMNEGLANSWRSGYEKEAIQAIQREADYVEELNPYNDWINLENGMYNLASYTLEPHHSKYLSTVRVPIHFNETATCPKFLRFMKDITNDNEELIKVHQELLGYWLTTETQCEKAVYYYGRGANGKSVLANLVSILVGSGNVSSVPLSQFSKNFGLEGIIGKTLNIAAENEMQGSRLNTEAFKSIVSGDGITINIKYRSPIVNYKSKCRLLFLGNELPDTTDLTQGYFRKLVIIPFKRTFTEAERNRNLLEELKEELPGIFNWAIEGLNRLKKQKYIFSHSKVIEAEMSKYRLAQNPVLHFFESSIEIEVGSKIRRPSLYEAFQKWSHEQGMDSSALRSRQRFFKDFENVLDGKGIILNQKRINGYEYLVDISIKNFS